MRVVGIGASAGGMEALIGLLSNIPDDTGAAFVLILHLSPDHKSIMDELLATHTGMPISVVEKVSPVKANHIYIIAKEFNLTLENNMLITQPRQSRDGLNLPIDLFFHSLGQSLKEKAIGVILSGTGTDGSRGVRTIKEAGGMVLVQSPGSAKFDGMPQAVIRLNLADQILTPAELGKTLTTILKWPMNGNSKDPLEALNSERAKPFLNRVLGEVLRHTGVDFSGYREATLNRRLANRLLLQRLSDPESYLELLKENKEEALLLHNDFLIGVTRFFRDPQAFEALEENVIAQLLKEKGNGDDIRIWVPACSTGEEAYSIALYLAHALESRKLNIDFKIFGTDIDSNAIKLASEGEFPHNCFPDIPEHLLMSYFVKRADFYRIKAEIRDKMLFAVHNLLNDPPFIHMDLISCRNALIYFKNTAQRAVLSTFHFALNPSGYLFLGPSESLGEVKHAYVPVEKKWNIFKRRENSQLSFQSRHRVGNGQTATEESQEVPSEIESDKKQSYGIQPPDPFTQHLIEEFVPRVLFVNADLDVIYTEGDIGELLSFPRGNLGFNLQYMVGSDQLIIFKNGVDKALENDGPVLYRNIVFDDRTESAQHYHLKFSRGPVTHLNAPTVMVSFLKANPPAKEEEKPEIEEVEVGKIEMLQENIQGLNRRLEQAQKHSRNLVGKLETTNEELQSSNRELLASNEELQSTNEELQSVNEELHTVNNELQIKNESLIDANNDINNLLKSTEIGTIFLDADLRIRRFTPAIRRQFNLLGTDIGRPITHFSSTLQGIDISKISRRVYKTLESFEQDVTDRHGNHYLLRILPYRTEKNQIKGLVINFVDVNELIKVKDQIKTFAKKFHAIFEYSHETIMVLEKDGRIRRINKDFGPFQQNDLFGQNLFSVLPKEQCEELRRGVVETYEKQQPSDVVLELPGTEEISPATYKGCIIPVLDQGEQERIILNVIIIWQISG